MTTTGTMEMLPLKQENEDTDEDVSFEDIDNLLSMPLPSLSNKLLVPTDPGNEFLRLTTMVRAVYFSYLHKCLLSNYIFCYKEKNQEIPCVQLKKCADQMELNAVRSALEASLYRQHMLKLISDIKSHTTEKKAYKNLVIFLETPPDKVDVAVQTNNSWAELERLDNIQSVCITSNCEEVPTIVEEFLDNDEEDVESKCETQIMSPYSSCNKTASPTVNSTSFHEAESNKLNAESDEEVLTKALVDEDTIKLEADVFAETQDTAATQPLKNPSFITNDDENSQDSLLQHMEDMFCESDDSSDITKLIEKHSGVTKANVDKEIVKMCLESDSFLPQTSSNSKSVPAGNNSAKTNNVTNNAGKIAKTTTPGKFSFSYYKEMKSRGMDKPLPPEPETAESKQRRRTNGIWFVERVHQVSMLKAKMTELSLRNYRKHGRVKEKFVELFGESDDEEMMPDSPICIEDHLTACKERIAPWIVNHLMPFYKKRRIKDRQLFKAVAKHIADMLIIEDTFPEQDCVSKYIENYFKNKKCIKTKQDIYI